MTDFAILASGLHVARGGTDVLHSLSFALPAGGVTGLLGPSGSGKTTLLGCVLGVQVISGGTITVLGQPGGHPSLRSRIGYASQAASVYDDLTVVENLRYFAAAIRAPAGDVDRVIEAVDLGQYTGRVAGRLSGGQRSRVSLAVAMLGTPALLVLDEPTVGLDPVLREDLWALFHRLTEGGTTLLVSSHVMDEAERCDQLLLLREGAVLAHDTPAALKQRTGTDSMDGAFLQLRHDPRTVALMVVVPALLIALLRYVFDSTAFFDRIAPALLGFFPFLMMFLITSITMLRERTSGTLERLLTTPMAKLDLLGGYGLAFSAVAVVQVLVAVLVSLQLGLSIAGSVSAMLVVALLNALLGVALGLLASAFARTEFQAVQFMPVVVLPQLLLCGLFHPRAEMATVLRWVSDVMAPLVCGRCPAARHCLGHTQRHVLA